MFELGRVYAEGWGVKQDYEQARHWWKQASAKTEPMAMFKLGELYDKGQGIPASFSRARHWWRRSAAAGNANAMIALGDSIMKGGREGGGEKFGINAYFWYHLAASAGDLRAQPLLEQAAKQLTSEQLAEAQRRVASPRGVNSGSKD